MPEPEYELTDRTRGVVRRSSDVAYILYLHLLWLSWGHVVTLTRLTDAAPVSSTPTLPVPRD